MQHEFWPVQLETLRCLGGSDYFPRRVLPLLHHFMGFVLFLYHDCTWQDRLENELLTRTFFISTVVTLINVGSFVLSFCHVYPLGIRFLNHLALTLPAFLFFPVLLTHIAINNNSKESFISIEGKQNFYFGKCSSRASTHASRLNHDHVSMDVVIVGNQDLIGDFDLEPPFPINLEITTWWLRSRAVYDQILIWRGIWSDMETLWRRYRDCLKWRVRWSLPDDNDRCGKDIFFFQI